MDLSVLRDRNPLFVTLSDGSLRNGYTLKIINKAPSERRFLVAAEGPAGLAISAVGLPLSDEGLVVVVPPDELASVKVYLTAPANAVPGGAQPVLFRLQLMDNGASTTVESTFRGPQ